MLRFVFGCGHGNKESNFQVLFTLDLIALVTGGQNRGTSRLEFKTSFAHITLGPKFREHRRKEPQKKNITVVTSVNNMSPQTVICTFL